MFENSIDENSFYDFEYNNSDISFPLKSLINENNLNFPYIDEYFNNVIFKKTNNCHNNIPNVKLFPINEIPTESKTDKIFLLNKRIRTEENYEINDNEEEIHIEINNKTIANHKLGRRKRNKNYNKKANHTKFSKDNIMRKIKTRLFDEMLKKLNKSIKFGSGKFKSLNKKIRENLKKSLNIILLYKPIKDIFAYTQLNKRNEKIAEYNNELIKKIYDENKEKETINILEMKFQDFLNYIRNNHFEEFLQKIKDKEIKVENRYKNEISEEFDIDSYIEDVRTSIKEYENWFQKKKGRGEK